VSEIERGAGRGFALADELLQVRLVAKSINDVGLPIYGAVLEVGRVERGFLVHVLGKFLTETSKGNRRAVKRNRLRKKSVFHRWSGDDDRRELFRGVVACGARALDHKFGLLQDLGSRIVDEERVSDPRDNGETDGDDGDDNQVEFQ